MSTESQPVTDNPIDLVSVMGLTSGTSYALTNRGAVQIDLWEGALAPQSRNGIPLQPGHDRGWKIGSQSLWAWTINAWEGELLVTELAD